MVTLEYRASGDDKGEAPKSGKTHQARVSKMNDEDKFLVL